MKKSSKLISVNFLTDRKSIENSHKTEANRKSCRQQVKEQELSLETKVK